VESVRNGRAETAQKGNKHFKAFNDRTVVDTLEQSVRFVAVINAHFEAFSGGNKELCQDWYKKLYLRERSRKCLAANFEVEYFVPDRSGDAPESE
jgi:hypothetical protein